MSARDISYFTKLYANVIAEYSEGVRIHEFTDNSTKALLVVKDGAITTAYELLDSHIGYMCSNGVVDTIHIDKTYDFAIYGILYSLQLSGVLDNFLEDNASLLLSLLYKVSTKYYNQETLLNRFGELFVNVDFENIKQQKSYCIALEIIDRNTLHILLDEGAFLRFNHNMLCIADSDFAIGFLYDVIVNIVVYLFHDSNDEEYRYELEYYFTNADSDKSYYTRDELINGYKDDVSFIVQDLESSKPSFDNMLNSAISKM